MDARSHGSRVAHRCEEGSAAASATLYFAVFHYLSSSAHKDPMMAALLSIIRLRAANFLFTLTTLHFATFAIRPASAAVVTWASLGDGTYSIASNWFPAAAAPGPNDFVTFAIGFDNPYSVRFPGMRSFEPPGDYFASHLRVRDSNLTFTGTTQSFVSTSTYTITSTVQAEVNRGVIIGLSVGDRSSLTLRHIGTAAGFWRQ